MNQTYYTFVCTLPHFSESTNVKCLKDGQTTVAKSRLPSTQYPLSACMALANLLRVRSRSSNCGKRKMNRPWTVRVRFVQPDSSVQSGFGCQTIWVRSVRNGLRMGFELGVFGSIPISSCDYFLPDLRLLSQMQTAVCLYHMGE